MRDHWDTALMVLSVALVVLLLCLAGAAVFAEVRKLFEGF